MVKKNTKFKIASGITLVIMFFLLGLMLFSGGNLQLLKSIFLEEHTNEELRDKLAGFGVRGYFTIALLSMLQVVIPVLPAEPVQVLGGLTFGFPIGLACCTVGVFLGNTVVYILYKTFGDKIREYFVKNLHLDLDKAARSKRIILIVFIMYFLPAIPYGMICFFAASVGMKYGRFITVTLLGAIPSVCIGVGLGHIAIASSWIITVIVFALILLLLTIVTIKRKAIFAKINEHLDKPPYSSKTTVRKYGPFVLPIANVIKRIVFFFKGVKVKYRYKVKGQDVASPSIVLVNHGSFVDFAYAGTLIRKKRPNFIVARLYFYKKLVGKFLKRIGCFPKSMFAMDIESAKNCVKVLREGGVLAMMPEARLSTTGKFEDIQEGTYHFLKKSRVPVYSIKIEGDYFAKPKWASKMRRGSYVEAELDILFTKDEIETLSIEEIKKRTEQRLYYDEFEWIKKHEKLRYKSKKLAEGLENILVKCPICKEKYTLSTKFRDITCERCGKIASLNDRYSFTDGKPFENFAEWYEWQKSELLAEISEDENYSLSSEVELKLPCVGGKNFLYSVGRGVATLTRDALTYVGTLDGENTTLTFPAKDIYRLLFGAGESFELYVGQKIHFFLPTDGRVAVEWYMASEIIARLREKQSQSDI